MICKDGIFLSPKFVHFKTLFPLVAICLAFNFCMCEILVFSMVLLPRNLLWRKSVASGTLLQDYWVWLVRVQVAYVFFCMASRWLWQWRTILCSAYQDELVSSEAALCFVLGHMWPGTGGYFWHIITGVAEVGIHPGPHACEACAPAY